MSADTSSLVRLSQHVLMAHKDKTFGGATVASMSIPWGETKDDSDAGGYHLVWTRDMVQTTTALPVPKFDDFGNDGELFLCLKFDHRQCIHLLVAPRNLCSVACPQQATAHCESGGFGNRIESLRRNSRSKMGL